jgi:hypothetical protein
MSQPSYQSIIDKTLRVIVIGKSQPAKNRNLSRLISKLSRLEKKITVLVYPVIFPVY